MSLLSAVITRLVNVFNTLVSVYAVDKAKRRALLLEAVVQMFIMQSIIGIILAIWLKPPQQQIVSVCVFCVSQVSITHDLGLG